MKNFVLGTAQLGSDYGVANKSGKPNQKMATEIIKLAWQKGIREFDTAQGYGSEVILGKAFTKLGISKKVKVTTKLHPSLDHLDERSISKSLDRSLKNLGVPIISTILLHHEESLTLWNKG
ncbi:MAG: aldo/keto reductase, partial [Patescibacteria group bacterium]